MSADSTRLTPEINLVDMTDSRAVAIGRVPANSRVLDLGLINGSVARSLKEMGCRVWGVTLDRAVPDMTLDVCERVIGADLKTLDIIELVGDQKFDVILMLDVLEHLGNPAALLQALPTVLADNGWGVISLPNVAQASLHLDLLQGRFNYSDTGPLDRTQVRFFDRRGVDDLLEQAGWQMFDLARVIKPFDVSELQVDGAAPERARELEPDIDASTHQFVLAVAPLGSTVLTHRPVLPAAVAQHALLEAMNRMRELEEEVQRLSKHYPPDLVDQLDEIREKALERTGKLQDILVAIRES
jgi:2-polyprenyl-3-methyl-5-hydroxy-6-metoxy-1,4-benzoquinol methylase